MSDWNLPQQDNEKFFEWETKMHEGVNAPYVTDAENRAIIDYLSNLSLLYDVPFAYLVPSQKMLVDNEIKFFYLDTNWIRILLDGVCSLGRIGKMDYTNDVRFLKEIVNNALTSNKNIRRKLKGKPILNKYELHSNGEVPVCTGFLLRSELVSGWRGLEFIAYGDPQNEESVLSALRLETISKDILLGIYQGVIKKLEIKQPPEGFHYGFDKHKDGGKTTLKKSLRTIEDGKLIYKNGKCVQIEVVQRENRVINFKETAKAIGKSPDLFKDITKETSINGAHIALEMIQNPYKIQILAKEQQGKSISSDKDC